MIRHKLSAPLFVLGCVLFMNISSVSAASNEPGIHFYPVKQWNTVSSPESVAGATVHRCKIANEFNNGFVLQLNGSHKWVESLQIDFRQDAFTSNKNYDVGLNVPGLKHANLSAKAVTSRLLSIPLSGEKDTYQAMRDSSVFDLAIDGNTFRFYMVGFADNATDFERCMAGGNINLPKAPAEQMASSHSTPTTNEAIAYELAEKSGVPVQEVLPPTPDAEIIDVTVKTVSEQAAESEIPLAIRAVKEQGEPRKRLSDTLAEEIFRNPTLADVQIQEPSNSSDKFSVQPSPSAADSKTARSGLVIPPSFNESTSLPSPSDAKSKDQSLELDSGDDALVEVKQVNAIPAVKNAPTEPIEVTTEKHSIRPKIHKQSGRIEADFTDHFAADDMPHTPADYDKGQRPDPNMARKISQLEKTIKRLEEENAALNLDLKATIADTKQESLSISNENWNLERATRQFNEAERQLKRLGQQLQQERAACALEKQELEAMLFDPSLTEDAQMAKLAKLRRELADTKEQLRAALAGR